MDDHLTKRRRRPFPADYIVDHKVDGSIFITDLDRGNKSVTNDVEGVLEELKSLYNLDLRGITITYLDSMGCVDRIVHVNGKFIRFEPLPGGQNE